MRAASAVVLLMLVGAGCAPPKKEAPATEPGDPVEDAQPRQGQEEPLPSEAESETDTDAQSPSSSEPQTLADGDAIAHCLKLDDEAARCPDETAALLVQLRVEHDPRFASVSQRPSVRESSEAKAKEAILANAARPLEEREDRCADALAKGAPVLASEASQLASCLTAEDCAQRVQCLRPGFTRRMFPGRNAAPAR